MENKVCKDCKESKPLDQFGTKQYTVRIYRVLRLGIILLILLLNSLCNFGRNRVVIVVTL